MFWLVLRIYLSLTSENAQLQLSIRMDFFDKLRSSLSSPLRHFQQLQYDHDDSLPTKTWTLPLTTFTLNHIRLLLFRDCDRRGRKCLYDSHHVIRDKHGKFSYIPTGSNGSEMKDLSEYIFGCVPLTTNCGTKRFHKYEGKYIWSQVFSPKQKMSDSSGSNNSCSPCKIKSSFTNVFSCSPTPNACLVEDQVDSSSVLMGNVINGNSLPNMDSKDSVKMGKCLSLPSRLVDAHQKTLLGLGIMIETSSENKDTLGPYLQSISNCLEECSSWFSLVASQAYCSPNTFVQTLYDFSHEIKRVLYSRLVSPLVCPMGLVPSWKTLPSLTAELVHLLLQIDECRCKSNQRTKIVLVGSSRRTAEVKGLLYLFKLLLLKCNTETDVGIDATTFCDGNPSNQTLVSPIHQSSHLSSVTTLSSCSGSSSTSESMSTSMSSPASISLPARLIQQANVQILQPTLENEKLQKRDYDSGIELELDSSSSMSIKSMRRSISQKFESNSSSSSGCESSSDEKGGRGSRKGTFLPHQYSHEYEEVCFHLGDLGIDSDQSINNLALSEPNLDKLRVYHGTTSPTQPLLDNRCLKLSLDPIEVKLNFGSEAFSPPAAPLLGGPEPSSSTHRSINPFCQYCDSIGIVDKFSPLYYIQWIKGSCELTEESFNLMRTFSTSKFLVLHLDKSYIRAVNFESCDSTINNNPTGAKNRSPMVTASSTCSNLVNNLLHNLLILSKESREGEIEHFLHIQLEFIKKIAQDFGRSWLGTSSDEDIVKKKYAYLNLSDSDLKLIYSLAKMRFPYLPQFDKL